MPLNDIVKTASLFIENKVIAMWFDITINFGHFMGSKHHFMGSKLKFYEFTFSIGQFAMYWWYLKFTIAYKNYPKAVLCLCIHVEQSNESWSELFWPYLCIFSWVLLNLRVLGSLPLNDTLKMNKKATFLGTPP